jgi:hypothetical protein
MGTAGLALVLVLFVEIIRPGHIIHLPSHSPPNNAIRTC